MDSYTSTQKRKSKDDAADPTLHYSEASRTENEIHSSKRSRTTTKDYLESHEKQQMVINDLKEDNHRLRDDIVRLRKARDNFEFESLDWQGKYEIRSCDSRATRDEKLDLEGELHVLKVNLEAEKLLTSKLNSQNSVCGKIIRKLQTDLQSAKNECENCDPMIKRLQELEKSLEAKNGYFAFLCGEKVGLEQRATELENELRSANNEIGSQASTIENMQALAKQVVNLGNDAFITKKEPLT